MENKESFALVPKYTCVRVVMLFISSMGWRIHYMDVKTTFLNGITE